MPTQDELIARHLQESLSSGELSGAKGFGQPLPEDAGWSETPEELRMPFKIFKNAGFVPVEVEWFKERAVLSQALAECTSELDAASLQAKLSELEQRIALQLEALRMSSSL